MRNTTFGLCTCIVILFIMAVGSPVLAAPPSTFVSMPPMDPDHLQTGGITTRVVQNGTYVAGAYVAIVNAKDPSQGYFHGTTNSEGYYQIVQVNNSWSPSGYLRVYMIYARDAAGNEGYTNPIYVDMGTNTWEPIYLNQSQVATPTSTPTLSPSPTSQPTLAPTPVLTPPPTVMPSTSVTPTAGTVTPVPVIGQNSTDARPTPVPSNLAATPGQTNATAIPALATPTSTSTPGFEALLALVGFVGFATLRSGMKSRK